MSLRRSLVIVIALALLVGVALAAWRWYGRAREPALASEIAREPESAPPGAPEGEPRTAPPTAPGAGDAAPELPLGLGAVDLEAVRAALPDNLYWQTAAPTQDPELLEEREREKALRNEQYGKILSGTGTEEEILDYYEHRMHVSTDYVAFTDYLLEHHGSDLTDQDLTLLHVARRLQLARLEEIPRKIEEAKERRNEQVEAQRKWLEEERAFQSDSESPPEDAQR